MLKQLLMGLTLKEATTAWHKGDTVGAVLLFVFYCGLSES
jgi:hypothetical protein